MSEENKNIDNEKNDLQGNVYKLYNDESPDKNAEHIFKSKKKKISLSTFIISSIALVLVSSMLTFTVLQGIYRSSLASIVGNGFWNASSGDVEKIDDIKLLDLLFDKYSLYDLDDREIAIAALKAYAEATGDKYAEYYSQEEYEKFDDSTSGKFDGIGVNIIYTSVIYGEQEYKVMKIVNIFPESPAMEAGLKVGDMMFYVGTDEETRQSVDSLGYANTMSALLGKAGTTAKFVVLRASDDGVFSEIPFEIERRSVKSESVSYRVCATDDSVGIVRITEFNLTTPTQFSNAVDVLRAKGIEKFVFDVRYNPGGDLRSIVAVLSYFLDENQTIISTSDKDGNRSVIKAGVTNKYSDEAEGCNVSEEDLGKYKGLKVAVLCNNNTASAAELFAANFRDYELGVLVGELTYGKGSMQSIIPLSSYGRKGAVRLTTKMYFPPCAESYDGIGITPDIVVELDEKAANINIYELSDADDNQLQEAIKTFK